MVVWSCSSVYKAIAKPAAITTAPTKEPTMDLVAAPVNAGAVAEAEGFPDLGLVGTVALPAGDIISVLERDWIGVLVVLKRVT